MHLIWGLMSYLQLLNMILQYNLVVPNNVYVFFKSIDDLQKMKAQFLNDILEKITNAIGLEQGESLKNTTTYILAGIAITLGIILVFLLKRLSSRYKWALSLYEKLRLMIFFSTILRVGLQSFATFAVIACGCMRAGLDFSKSDQSVFKSFANFVLILAVIAFPIFTLWFLSTRPVKILE